MGYDKDDDCDRRDSVKQGDERHVNRAEKISLSDAHQQIGNARYPDGGEYHNFNQQISHCLQGVVLAQIGLAVRVMHALENTVGIKTRYLQKVFGGGYIVPTLSLTVIS